MAKRLDKHEKPEPHVRLITARIEAGFERPTDAAKANHWVPATYAQHENGHRALSRQAAEVYAARFRVNAGWLLYGDVAPRGKIPSMRFGGIIGAGQQVIPSDQIDGKIEGTIGAEDGEAFDVVGDSMFPVARPGDRVFFGTPRPPKMLIGCEAIVELSDGTRLFKTIERGSKPGLYDLISYNASPIRDVEIVRAGPFLGVRRRGH